jgi:AcrR family transcriptional regulator
MSAPERREVIERAASEVFSERGYHGASMDAIAARAGISAPVLYDHFASKRELHRCLLERHFAALRRIWREQLAGDEPAGERIPRAFDAWFAYVQEHPYAWRMLFRDTTGDPAIEALHREVAAASRAEALPLLARESFAQHLAGPDPLAQELLWEVVRAVLQGLAMWWHEHQDVPREEIVAIAMNTLWIGFERTARGERWVSAAPPPACP